VPWTLDIHTIDVGVGEASLVVIDHPGTAGAFRSILIDGGLSASAPIVHAAVTARLPPAVGPDVILVTHYDIDHSDGLANLMFADNLSALVEEVAAIAAPYAVTALAAGAGGDQVIAGRVACAAFGAMRGSWGPHAGAVAAAVGSLTQAMLTGQTIAGAAQYGTTAGSAYEPYGVTSLITAPLKTGTAARDAGVAAAAAFAGGNAIQPAIEVALFNQLGTLVPPLARFRTGGIYNTARVIDIGAVIAPKATYLTAARGSLNSGSPPGTVMPNVARPRTGNFPPLGRELFWNGAAPPAANAPYAVVLSGPEPGAAMGRVWQGVGVPSAAYNSGDVRNDKSIGLVIRFNDFVYFTAGDMPFEGEDLLYPALLAQALPNGAGGTLPAPAPPPPLVAFKCGHHGAATATSAGMLAALQPLSAHISCGGQHGHPFQSTINLLHNDPQMQSVLLTNCRYNRANVLASPPGNLGPPPAPGTVDQWLAGSKALIAGDNAVANGAAMRHRGDISIQVLEANSAGAPGTRSYDTAFFDEYPPAAGGPPGHVQVNQVW
jgi:hypothetical protein